MAMARRQGLVASAMVALAALAALTWLANRPAAVVAAPDRQTTVNATSAGWSLLALGSGDTGQRSQTTAPRPSRSPEDVLHTLFTDGSLRGSTLDGGWGPWDGQRLRPDAALRRRFDQLLTTVGETTADELRQLVAWLAERDLGPRGAQAVLAVWDRYLTLQRHSFRETMDMTQPDRWPRVLQERQTVRRELLGSAWAEAFYAAEEDALRQRLGQSSELAKASAPVPAWTDPAPAGTAPEAWHSQRVTALGQEAADRLLAAERAQADWEQRLATARQAVDGLARAPELSPLQRQAAIQRWVDTHFQGSERLRAGALLGL